MESTAVLKIYYLWISAILYRLISHQLIVKGIIKKILLTICVIGAPTSVYALPFRADPQSFQNYLNQITKWDDGSKMYYQNLGNCAESIEGFFCAAGFVTVTNPMGVKVCSIEAVWIWKERVNQRWHTCRNK